MSMPDIASLVPHAKPMLIIDRVISADEESLIAEVNITPDSLFCQEEGAGAWIGIEYMAQTIAAHAGYMAHLSNEPVKIGFLLGTRNYVCDCSYFAIGSVLRINVKRVFQSDNGTGSYKCSITDSVNNELAGNELATATLTVFQPINPKEFVEGNVA